MKRGGIQQLQVVGPAAVGYHYGSLQQPLFKKARQLHVDSSSDLLTGHAVDQNLHGRQHMAAAHAGSALMPASLARQPTATHMQQQHLDHRSVTTAVPAAAGLAPHARPSVSEVVQLLMQYNVPYSRMAPALLQMWAHLLFPGHLLNTVPFSSLLQDCNCLCQHFKRCISRGALSALSAGRYMHALCTYVHHPVLLSVGVIASMQQLRILQDTLALMHTLEQHQRQQWLKAAQEASAGQTATYSAHTSITAGATPSVAAAGAAAYSGFQRAWSHQQAVEQTAQAVLAAVSEPGVASADLPAHAGAAETEAPAQRPAVSSSGAAAKVRAQNALQPTAKSLRAWQAAETGRETPFNGAAAPNAATTMAPAGAASDAGRLSSGFKLSQPLAASRAAAGIKSNVSGQTDSVPPSVPPVSVAAATAAAVVPATSNMMPAPPRGSALFAGAGSHRVNLVPGCGQYSGSLSAEHHIEVCRSRGALGAGGMDAPAAEQPTAHLSSADIDAVLLAAGADIIAKESYQPVQTTHRAVGPMPPVLDTGLVPNAHRAVCPMAPADDPAADTTVAGVAAAFVPVNTAGAASVPEAAAAADGDSDLDTADASTSTAIAEVVGPCADVSAGFRSCLVQAVQQLLLPSQQATALHVLKPVLDHAELQQPILQLNLPMFSHLQQGVPPEQQSKQEKQSMHKQQQQQQQQQEQQQVPGFSKCAVSPDSQLRIDGQAALSKLERQRDALRHELMQLEELLLL